MIIGSIACGLFVSLNISIIPLSKNIQDTMKYAHVMVLFIAMGLVLNAIFIYTCVTSKINQWNEYNMISAKTALEYVEKRGNKNGNKIKIFKFYRKFFLKLIIGSFFPNVPQRMMEYFILKNAFVEYFELGHRFNFHNYLSQSLNYYIIDFNETSAIVWFLLIGFIWCSYINLMYVIYQPGGINYLSI